MLFRGSTCLPWLSQRQSRLIAPFRSRSPTTAIKVSSEQRARLFRRLGVSSSTGSVSGTSTISVGPGREMKISSTDAHRSHYKLTNVNFGAIVTNAFADGGSCLVRSSQPVWKPLLSALSTPRTNLPISGPITRSRRQWQSHELTRRIPGLCTFMRRYGLARSPR